MVVGLVVGAVTGSSNAEQRAYKYTNAPPSGCGLHWILNSSELFLVPTVLLAVHVYTPPLSLITSCILSSDLLPMVTTLSPSPMETLSCDQVISGRGSPVNPQDRVTLAPGARLTRVGPAGVITG